MHLVCQLVMKILSIFLNGSNLHILKTFRFEWFLILFVMLFYVQVTLSGFDTHSAEGVAKLVKQLPHLNYSMGSNIWAQLSNGSASNVGNVGEFGRKQYRNGPPIAHSIREEDSFCSSSSALSPSLVSAELLATPMLFTDLNGDGLADALVIIRVVYTGIGYFDLFVVPVIMQPTGKAMVSPSSGYKIGETSVYAIDSFNLVSNAVVELAFMDRHPGEPKTIAPSVPTVLALKYNTQHSMLDLYSKRILAKDCYSNLFVLAMA